MPGLSVAEAGAPLTGVDVVGVDMFMMCVMLEVVDVWGEANCREGPALALHMTRGSRNIATHAVFIESRVQLLVSIVVIKAGACVVDPLPPRCC